MDILNTLRHVRIDAWLRPVAHNPLEDQRDRDVFLRTALFNEHLNALARAYGLYIKNTMGDQFAIDYTHRRSNEKALQASLRMRDALLPAAHTSFHESDLCQPLAV